MGLFDSVFRDVANTLITTLGTSVVTFTRVIRVYDPIEDEDVESTVTANLAISPPSPYSDDMVNGSSILSTDAYALVAAKACDDAGFDMNLGSNSSITLVFNSVTYKIVSVKKIYSGDQIAAYEIHLR